MYTYRMAQPPDLPWLDQVAPWCAWESLSDEERAIAHPGQVAQAARAELRAILGTPGGVGLIAQHRQAPVGYLLGAVGPDTTTHEMHGHVIALWVAPEHRRRGVGKTLQGLAESLFERQGLRKVKVWTGLHNQAAVNLAKKRGYTPEGLIGMKRL